MLRQLPKDLQQCIYKDWIADVHDLSSLDIAWCNHALRIGYLLSLSGLYIDFFDFGTNIYTNKYDTLSFLHWIAYRKVCIAELTIHPDWIEAVSSPLSFSASLHISTLYLADINWAKKYDHQLQIIVAIFRQVASLVVVNFGFWLRLSSKSLHMLERALANCHTLSRVVLRVGDIESSDALFSFLCSHKDALKDVNLGCGLGVLHTLSACHALESISLKCNELDPASILPFCGHHPQLKALSIKCRSGFEVGIVQAVLGTCPCLRSLTLRGHKCRLTADMVNDILNRYPKLVYLSASNITITVKCQGNVKTCGISVGDSRMYVDSIIEQIQLPIHAFELLIYNSRGSELVRLVGDRAGKALKCLVHNILEGLELDDDDAVYEDLIYTLKKCPNIQELRVSCAHFDLIKMMAQIAFLRNLRSLWLCDLEVENLPKNLHHAIAKLPLHSLHLIRCGHCCDSLIWEIVEEMPELKVLEISESEDAVNGRAISRLIDVLSPVTTLLVDYALLSELTIGENCTVLSKKLIKRGRVQTGGQWRQQHPTL